MAANDLCTLYDVKAWLGRSDTNSDALLASLITRTSRQILSYLRRPAVLPHTVSEVSDGTGGSTLMLREWPVLSVAGVAVCGHTVPPTQQFRTPGFAVEPWNGAPPGRAQMLVVAGAGYCFERGAQNINITYRAGYQVTAEAQTVANGAVTVIAPYGAWASDGGVAYADGTPLVQVGGPPAPGQYQLANPGAYNFNAGDDGAAVLVTYGYVPADLADAAIELVGERFKYAQRIGETSHSLGGNETVAFDNARFTPFITQLLAPYRHVLPI